MKNICEKEADSNAQWFVGLRANHSNITEQDPVTIIMLDIQESFCDSKNFWIKKLTTLHERLAAQTNQLLAQPPRTVDTNYKMAQTSAVCQESFRLEKCSRIVPNRRKVVRTDNVRC